MGKTNQRSTLETLNRTIQIVEALEELDGAGVTELADYLDLPPSTIHGYLSTLEENRCLIKEGKEYNIGLWFLVQGGYASVRKKGFRLAKQKVKELATETGERAQLHVEEHGRGIYLHTESHENAVQIDARIGKETHLHASAAGKSILANLPERRVDEIIDRWGLPLITAHTITDRDELEDELESIRKRGFSFNYSESVEGLRACGVPVTNPDGSILGALSVSGPANRMQGDWFEEELPQLLLGSANEIELNIAYD